MTYNEINALCAELANQVAEENTEALVADIEEDELDARMLAMGPRAYGPDADEGSDDCSGNFYWDLK